MIIKFHKKKFRREIFQKTHSYILCVDPPQGKVDSILQHVKLSRDKRLPNFVVCFRRMCNGVFLYTRMYKKMIIQRPKEKCLEIKHISGKEKNTHYFVIPLSKDVGTFW